MEKNISTRLIGYIFKRKSIKASKIQNLLQTLYIKLFEANVSLQALQYFESKKTMHFDSLVGDNKCQTRTSMLLDLLEDTNFSQKEILIYQKKLCSIILQIKNIIYKVKNANHAELKKLNLYLQKNCLYEYFNSQNINLELPEDIKFISLCLMTSLNNEKLLQYANQDFISSNKIKNLIFDSKKELCDLSIKYEYQLAKQHGCKEIQKSLSQIESKGICLMTSFFPSFKIIFDKMKKAQQPFVKRKFIFCYCGGIKKNNFKLFKPHNNSFIEAPLNSIKTTDIAMIIDGYQYNGSLYHLKQILQIPENEVYIPIKYQKICTCFSHTPQSDDYDIEEAILANFAQHPQFTNKAEIDFEKLELIGSSLQKEYDYLKALKGYSKNNMSKFCIDHIYPSTIKDALQSELPPYQPAQQAIQKTHTQHPETSAEQSI